jgi:hypothetical protein
MRMGSAVQPKEAIISSGQVAKERFAPVHKAVFFTGVGLSAALGITAGLLGASFNMTQDNYKRLGAINGQDGAVLAREGTAGKELAVGTNAALITTGAVVVLTGIAGLLTNFE